MTKDEALDLALEALEQWITPRWAGTGVDKANAAYTAIKQARSAPYVATSLVQEPVGWWDAKIGFFEEKHFDQLQPLYASPPAAQRQWVGLTDWEISQLWFGTSPYFNEEDFAHAIEAKLKEKNNG